MKLLVTANQTPFIAGGANYHVEGLVGALKSVGHQVECLRLPFHYNEKDISRQMAFVEQLNCKSPNDVSIDRVISLQFPTYGIDHPEHTVWLMHQHRVCYDLYDSKSARGPLKALKAEVEAFDNRHLGAAKHLFANSPRVAERLYTYNALVAEPLYHPPFQAEHFTGGEDWGYAFYPSRLEPLKRQLLLLDAMAMTSTPIKLLLTGEGSQRKAIEKKIDTLGLSQRVRLLGHISEQEKRTIYAHARVVVFPPFDEDYGYVTLEAMLAEKPVITCFDSGGPTVLVENGVSGWQCESTPEALADKLDSAFSNKLQSRKMGKNGRDFYDAAQISWHKVVTKLLYNE